MLHAWRNITWHSKDTIFTHENKLFISTTINKHILIDKFEFYFVCVKSAGETSFLSHRCAPGKMLWKWNLRGRVRKRVGGKKVEKGFNTQLEMTSCCPVRKRLLKYACEGGIKDSLQLQLKVVMILDKGSSFYMESPWVFGFINFF